MVVKLIVRTQLKINKKGENIMGKNCRNFKTKFWAWIMIFTLVLGGGTYGTSISVKADIIVYVTPTGSKYHTHACGRGNYQPSTLSAAKASGLTPCSKCFPNGAPSGNSSKGTHKKTVTKVTKVKVKHSGCQSKMTRKRKKE